MYFLAWVVSATVTFRFLFRHRQQLDLTPARYGKFLLQPWKVVTFLLAFAGVVYLSRYEDDPTWNYATIALKSVLIFATAPWSIATLYRATWNKVPNWFVLPALVVWMFAASWSYDLFLLIRHGFYPLTWAANILPSSFVYCAAGLYWNVDWNPQRGTHFAFSADDWPKSGGGFSFQKVLWVSFLFLLAVGFALIPLWWRTRA